MSNLEECPTPFFAQLWGYMYETWGRRDFLPYLSGHMDVKSHIECWIEVTKNVEYHKID